MSPEQTAGQVESKDSKCVIDPCPGGVMSSNEKGIQVVDYF